MAQDFPLAQRLVRLKEQPFEVILATLHSADPLELTERVAATEARLGLWLPPGLALAKVRRAVARAISQARAEALDESWLNHQIDLAAQEATNHAAAHQPELQAAWRTLSHRAAAHFGQPDSRGFDVLALFHTLPPPTRRLLQQGLTALTQNQPRALPPTTWREFESTFRDMVRTLTRVTSDADLAD